MTTLLMDAFMSTKLKSRSEESKLVEVKNIVLRLDSDLTAVKHQSHLQASSYAISNIVKLLPKTWLTRWSEMEDKKVIEHGSQWKAI